MRVMAFKLNNLILSSEAFEAYCAVDPLLEKQVAERHGLDRIEDAYSLLFALSVVVIDAADQAHNACEHRQVADTDSLRYTE